MKKRQARLGEAFGLYQVTVLRRWKPSSCSANPMEKMTCWVPDTHSVPDGLSTRRTAPSQRAWKAWSPAIPRDASQRPLSTLARLPLWQVVPPFDSMYGGSAKATSTECGGSFSSAATQSPRTSDQPRPRSAVPGNPSHE